MNRWIKWFFAVAGLLLMAESSSAQRNNKPLDRGIHKRRALRGFTILKEERQDRRQGQSSFQRADKQHVPIASIASFRCPPLQRHDVTIRPRLVFPLLRRLPVGQCPRPLLRRKTQSIEWPAPPRFLHAGKTEPEREANDGKPQSILSLVLEFLGPIISSIGLFVGIRAIRKGQRFGDFWPGGYTRPNPQGMVLGGAMTLIGFFVGVLTLGKTLLASPLGTLDALNPRQRVMVPFLYFAAVAGAIMSIEMWPYLWLAGIGFFIHLFVRYS